MIRLVEYEESGLLEEREEGDHPILFDQENDWIKLYKECPPGRPALRYFFVDKSTGRAFACLRNVALTLLYFTEKYREFIASYSYRGHDNEEETEKGFLPYAVFHINGRRIRTRPDHGLYEEATAIPCNLP